MHPSLQLFCNDLFPVIVNVVIVIVVAVGLVEVADGVIATHPFGS